MPYAEHLIELLDTYGILRIKTTEFLFDLEDLPNKADNRKKNLRCCEHSENDRNRSLYSCNTSGVAGVYFDKERKKWVASITYNHKKVYLGRYSVKEEAILARLTKEVELYKEFSPQRGLLESLNL